jgi:hypothetical protein
LGDGTFENMESLVTLNLHGNNFTTLNLDGAALSQLNQLNIDSSVTTISLENAMVTQGAFDAVMRANIGLTVLDLDNTDLSSLTMEGMYGLDLLTLLRVQDTGLDKNDVFGLIGELDSMKGLAAVWVDDAFAGDLQTMLTGAGYDTVVNAVIPEPGTLGLMSITSTGLLFWRRRMRRRKSVGMSVMPVRARHRADEFDAPTPVYEIEQQSEHVVKEAIISQLSSARQQIAGMKKSLGNRFWDSLIALDEAMDLLKQKALNAFDAFLALIMK